MQTSRLREVLALVVLIGVLAGVAYAAQKLTLLSWNAVVQYHSPFSGPLPPGEAGPPLAHRVVLVIVDGLRLDTSRTMRTLNLLRGQGADFGAWTGEPSLSYPGWTLIVTGAMQEVSGVTTNWYSGAVRVDSLFAAAKRAGLRTAVAGSSGWGELFGAFVDDRILVQDPAGFSDIAAMYRTSDEVATGALDLLRKHRAQFVLVHFPSVDLLGHGFGGVNPQYAEAARRVDLHLGELLRFVDLSTTTVIVTSDHGHTDTGGHGGWEAVVKHVPLVLAGAGVRTGVAGGDVRQADIAPTVAVLLGLSVPAHNQGRPLDEALEADPRQFGLRWAEQQRVLYAPVADYLQAPSLSAVFAAPHLEALTDGPDGVVAFSDDVAREFAGARAARLARERQRRLPVALILAVLPAVYLALHSRKRLLVLSLAGAAAFFALDYGLFYGRGYIFSLSVFNTEALILRFFNRRLLDAAIAIAAGGLVVGFLASRRRASEAARAALDMGVLVAYAILLQVLYFYWLWDIRFAWYLPDLRVGFKYYLDLLMLVPVGYLAAGYILVALLGRAIGRLVLRPGTPYSATRAVRLP